ncbi:MAG: hypothetical protein JO159_09910 [Acidobacteria bacterium]|nr:hypothetical protein [Acidobacteriota bacterium]
MRVVLIASVIFLVCAVDLSSKDKNAKVSFQQMAAGMRDAFNCGVVVEEFLHGSLKGKADEYHKARQENNCDYVESVLNTVPDEH